MSFTRQTRGKYFLYALIGFLLMGGVGLTSSKTAHAADFKVSCAGTVDFGVCSHVLHASTIGTLTWYYGDYPLTSTMCGSPQGWVSYDIADQLNGYNPVTFLTGAGCSSSGNYWVAIHETSSADTYYVRFVSNGSTIAPIPAVFDTSTHFISVYPENGTTTATTSPLGANIHANPDDFQGVGAGYGRLHIHAVQAGAFACMNSGAVYDAVVTCAGDNVPKSPFDFDYGTSTVTQLLSGNYNLDYPYTFPGGGQWNIEYDIQQVSKPWYFLGLFSTYTTIVSTTTTVTIGQLSPIDVVRIAVASSTNLINEISQKGIGAILASTTASLKNSCNIISSGFSLGDCMTLLLWPGSDAIAGDFLILRELPPWGYGFRVIDILNATTSTTTLPTISYDFATSSPMSAVGNIHFDPFGMIAQSSDLVNQMTSDRADHLTVWQILMPVVKIFIYLVLAFMVIHDLTGIHKHAAEENKRRENKK